MESDLARTRRARRVARELAQMYPDAHCELNFTTPLELAVATILSAQCTDERVNRVTPALFGKYPNAAAYAGADRAEMEEIVRPTGFFRNKSAALIALGRALEERYDGQVPGRLPDLVALPGIGRKTANVILGNAFDVPGITVDTHVLRLSRRLGWTQESDPEKVERQLMGLIPRREWTLLSHRLIWHGRRVCFARRPACASCQIAKWCPSRLDVPARSASSRRKSPVRLAGSLTDAPARTGDSPKRSSVRMAEVVPVLAGSSRPEGT